MVVECIRIFFFSWNWLHLHSAVFSQFILCSIKCPGYESIVLTIEEQTGFLLLFFPLLQVFDYQFCTNSATFIPIPCKGSEVIPYLPRVQTSRQPALNVPLQLQLQCIPNVGEVPQNLNIISLSSVFPSRKSNLPCWEKRSLFLKVYSWNSSHSLKYQREIKKKTLNVKKQEHVHLFLSHLEEKKSSQNWIWIDLRKKFRKDYSPRVHVFVF